MLFQRTAHYAVVALFSLLSTATAQSIIGLKLIHAPSDRELVDLTNGMLVDPAALGVGGSPQFNIRTVVTTGVASVLFQPIGRNEATAPFAYCGDSNGDFYTCPEFTVGRTYTVTARGRSRTGATLPDFQVTFTIRGPNTPVPPPPVPVPFAQPVPLPVPFPAPVPVSTGSEIVRFRLIHAATDQELMDLTNGLLVDPVALGVSPSFNIRAIAASNIRSILFLPVNRNEAEAPFSYCGDSDGDFYDCPDLVVGGTYTIIARPRTFAGATLPDQRVTFTIRGPNTPGPPPPPPPPTPIALPAPIPMSVPTVVLPAPVPMGVGMFQSVRINCGGPEYLDTAGRLWMADQYFVGGTTYSNTAADILGTIEDTLYHTERYGALTYNIPIPEGGAFEVILHFAEIFHKTAGSRVFDVEVEGTLIQDIDVVQQGGGIADKALQRETTAVVSDGFLTIKLLENVPKIDNPAITAITVQLISPHFAHAVTGGPYAAVDTNGDGVEAVVVNARTSHTHGPGSTLTSAVWKQGATVLGNGLETSFVLPVGQHVVSLTVTDTTGKTDSDTTTVVVRAFGNPWASTLSPNSGTVNGGTVVTISGSSFGGATAVKFGLVTLTGNAITVTGNSVTVTAPMTGLGVPVSVSVLTPVGESNALTYTYVGASTIGFTIEKLLDFAQPTAIAFGPDGCLYVGNTLGKLGRFTLNASFDAVVSSVVTTVVSNARGIHGIAFDPLESADVTHPTVYVSTSDIFHGESRSSTGMAVNGKIQAVRGASLDQVSDIVTGLPISQHDHTVNGIYFGNNGELYIGVGSNTNGGLPGELSSSRLMKDNYFSSAMLVANLGRPGFSGFITYSAPVDGNPITGFGPTGVEVFAAGLRNPYGVVQHSNGQVYATDNGPNPGYGDMATGCGVGQQIPDAYETDELLRLQRGNYYGAPNLKRGETDPRQCVWKAASLPSEGTSYTAPMMKLSSSSDGIIEFDSDHFDGQLRGNLIVAKYQGPLQRIILSADGTTVNPSSNPALLLGGMDTLTLTQAPNGNLVDARFSKDTCFFYRPNETPSNVLAIQAVWPRRGGLAGGTKFTVYGVNFAAGATVLVGGRACTSPVVVSSTQLQCRLPAGTLGLKTVIVTSGGAVDSYTRAYRYITGTPL